MLPRSLTKRIFLAFSALGIAMLLAVSASLFLVLREAHQDELKQSLGNVVVVFEVSLVRNAVTGQAALDQRIQDSTTSIVDAGGFVLAQGPKGVVREVIGNPSSTPCRRRRPG